ncbi:MULTISPECIES: hypothetical protein [unclassified Mesorhizobium]|uniref:hypothetical protein n=1 Tax=unclassified Mesorhizobium TaxID=325217 RepID=UPI0011281C5A|nr:MULTISPECIES: hypothetical protein [unclassified Mesorhizobium]TPJ90351.1 hypothetical protein FJ491_31765 [Mesorhizobium sp. B2-5-10]MCA0016621.1 hypothetical protein [Mesorhizobium sp. B294B1A1]MCA0022653.1 hypothetical protein [Mesorhizobium sp. B264B1A]MCA0035617.1 hypothetical protein [Mesorhizobium sp. B263B2A]TPI66754.1 hypothetical protein FJ423_32990 [Mesorhizobium sp. B2-8-9]
MGGKLFLQTGVDPVLFGGIPAVARGAATQCALVAAIRSHAAARVAGEAPIDATLDEARLGD